MDNDTLRISAALRLGAKTCHPHSCQHCGKAVDELGTHGLSRSEINKIIEEACSSANVPASLEPSGTFRDDGKNPMASCSDIGLRASVFCGMLHVPTPWPAATSLLLHVPLVPLLSKPRRRSLGNTKEL
jgi:hypothetical protein